MADLVLQAQSKLLEDRDRGGGEGAPMFRTGSGRSVSVTESSIRKARSLLDGGSGADRDVLESGGSKDNGFLMFPTGSERSVTAKPSSLRKATTVLEREDLLKDVVEDGRSRDNGFSMFHTGSGKSVTVKQSSLRKATAVLEQEALQKGAGTVEQTDGSDDGFPMFRTGLGKSVMVKQSSIKKAVAVLEGDISKKGVVEVADSNDGFPMFHTGSGKSVTIRQSSIRKAAAVLEGDISQKGEVLKPLYCGANNADVLKFQTGSGKSVMLKQSSIRKAMAILQDGENIETEFLHPQSCGNNEDVPMFHTGAGKSVPLKQSSIRKAMTILKDGDNVETDDASNFTAEGRCTFSNSLVQNGSGKTVNTSFSVVKDQKTVDEVSRNKENISFALLQQNVVRSCYPPKIPPPVPTFTSPMKSSSTLCGTNFKGAMSNQKKGIGFCVEGIDQLNKCPPSTGQLMDISNFIHKDYTNMSVLTNDKKRPWRRSSISPFKRPRICRFTTPVNNSISFFTTDSTKLSTSENHPCRTRLSTHYPFKFRRKTLKEFFGGPPTETNLFGQLPAAVRNMKADNAEIYRFCDSSGLSVIGPEAFQNMLLQSGATSSSATKEWVANHYKWIVWKLACFERCYPAIACGKLLTASNVLEELKYRYEREVNYGHRSAIKKF
ncbi:protein BREAST CANCER SUSCEPTIBILITY 2-like protein B-like [Iris pallida]|uniref:Protein BREAST CANCER SUSCEPTIBILITY 2-like protein B-like n=1 Tax=Iris pallida TaxID=29817 RepID=A0AAX6E3Z1_IRIPA|nr:protein BREAST CANCER SUSCEPTIBILITY 2-like protein B-like [Iris pallida]